MQKPFIPPCVLHALSASAVSTGCGFSSPECEHGFYRLWFPPPECEQNIYWVGFSSSECEDDFYRVWSPSP